MIVMDRIDFFCLGAQKAGTTLLHDILIQHPNIYLPPNKEAHFFDVNELYFKGLNYYFNEYFNTFSNEKIIGNINPNLQIDNRSIDRIIDCFGNQIKIIFLMRDPVKRAYSHYLMSKKRGYEDLDFLDAIKAETDRILNPKPYKDYESMELGHFEKNHYGYISRGLYSKTLEYIFEKFPRENIRVYVFEEFINDKEGTIKDILTFLGVEQIKLNLDLKSNPAQKAVSYKLSKFLNMPSEFKNTLKKIIPKTLRKKVKKFANNKNMVNMKKEEFQLSVENINFIKEYFKEDISKVEAILNRKINFWNK